MPVRKPIYDNTHLTLEERGIIQHTIEKGSTKADIGRTLAKDLTTIAKEIKAHRIFKPMNYFNNSNICMHYKKNVLNIGTLVSSLSLNHVNLMVTLSVLVMVSYKYFLSFIEIFVFLRDH